MDMLLLTNSGSNDSPQISKAFTLIFESESPSSLFRFLKVVIVPDANKAPQSLLSYRLRNEEVTTQVHCTRVVAHTVPPTFDFSTHKTLRSSLPPSIPLIFDFLLEHQQPLYLVVAKTTRFQAVTLNCEPYSHCTASHQRVSMGIRVIFNGVDALVTGIFRMYRNCIVFAARERETGGMFEIWTRPTWGSVLPSSCHICALMLWFSHSIYPTPVNTSPFKRDFERDVTFPEIIQE
jgi:hypothetical protein